MIRWDAHLEGAMPLLEQPDRVALYASLGVRQISLCLQPQQRRGRWLPRRGSRPDTTGASHGRSRQRRRPADGLLTHRAPMQPGDHGDVDQTGDLQSCQPAGAGGAWSQHTDGQIRARATTGGVVCVSGVSRFLGNPNPTAQDVARHATYVAYLVGVRHVGIGLDIGFSEAVLNDLPPDDFDRNYWWPESAGYAKGIAGIRYTPRRSRHDVIALFQAANPA